MGLATASVARRAKAGMSEKRMVTGVGELTTILGTMVLGNFDERERSSFYTGISQLLLKTT